MRKTLALGASLLGALAPTAANVQAPGASGGVEISQARQVQGQQGMQSQTATTTAGSTLGLLPTGRGFRSGPVTDLFTFPAWNQRKARRKARQTGAKVKKRFYR